MKLLIRGIIFGFILIMLISYFVGGQVKQKTTMSNYQKQAEQMRNEQEQRACKQFMNARFCSSPRDHYERSLCKSRLTDFHCDKHVDVGYLMDDEENRQAVD